MRKFVVSALLLSLMVAAYGQLTQFLQYPDQALHVPEAGATWEVQAGSSSKQMVEQLAAQGFIRQPHLLLWHIKLQGLSRKIKAGEYCLRPTLNIREFLELVSQGKVKQHSFTIIEGWNFKTLLSELARSDKILHSTPEQLAQLPALLNSPQEYLEGQFLPETYYFDAHTRDVELLKRAHRALQNTLSDAWTKRALNLPYASPYEALIMASIIEKESRQVDEYHQVAGVYVRRLQKGMLLQANPTVVYCLGPEFNGRVLYSHLKKPSPYNTYLLKGLPPSPIAMPSRLAIHAALHPAPGDALYFVVNGQGGHVFSKTYEEHHAHVLRYRQRLKDAGT